MNYIRVIKTIRTLFLLPAYFLLCGIPGLGFFATFFILCNVLHGSSFLDITSDTFFHRLMIATGVIHLTCLSTLVFLFIL